MSNTEDSTKVKVKENNVEEFVTLGDLAGINLDDVKEQRGFAFPKGDYSWEVSTDPEDLPRLAAIGEDDKAKPAIIIPLKCLDVVRVNDDEFNEDPTTLIGKVHRESFFLGNDMMVSLGYFKAFAKDIGAPYAPALKDLIASTSGTRFDAPISKRKDKNDADKVYTSINRTKLKPMGAAEVSSVAAAVG